MWYNKHCGLVGKNYFKRESEKETCGLLGKKFNKNRGLQKIGTG